MIVFRGCGKCQGDMFVERNLDEADLVCLQCGYRRTIATSQLETAARVAKRELTTIRR
jgi:DNA-directed RNA polymerase subunit M/transcription elongation factor TFIIS